MTWKEEFEEKAEALGYDLTPGDKKDLWRRYKSHATMDFWRGYVSNS